MRHTTWVAVAGAGLLLTGGLTAEATAGRTADGDRRDGFCERSFDRAQRADMESFRDFDAETWREGTPTTPSASSRPASCSSASRRS